VRTAIVVEVLELAQRVEQVPLVPDQRAVERRDLTSIEPLTIPLSSGR
jgi:hypothetical protein